MRFNCITYQVTLDEKYSRYVDYYYNRSLRQFISELSNPNSLNNIYTFYAGLMLCNISVRGHSLKR